jgi:hypothetical protein
MFRLAGVSADLTFTARLFRRAPAFSSIAILSLALGIGASSAIFSLVYAVLLDPYPYKNADRLIAPTFSDRRGDEGRIWYTIEDYLTVQKSSATLEDAILFSSQPFVATRGVPEDVKGLVSCPNFFDFMGVPAMLGRTYTRNDIPVPQTPPRIAVISYLFWLRRFDRDPRAIGKSLELDHQLYTVIGVVPPRFTWTDFHNPNPFGICERRGPAVLQTPECNPEEPVERAESGTGLLPLEHDELLAKSGRFPGRAGVEKQSTREHT